MIMQDSENNRRIPRQDRARETVSTFFEATAQLLDKVDAEGVTTNHVAEKAGFSIGTLYRYFSGKRSLLEAMAAHEMGRQEEAIGLALAGCTEARLEEIVRIVVRASLHPFAGRPRVRRAMLRHMAQNPQIVRRFDQMIERLGEALCQTIARAATGPWRQPSDEARFIMLRAMVGAIRQAAVFRVALIDSPAFEDELVRMVAAFFKD
jgi:AcrR family transcriptional regulator